PLQKSGEAVFLAQCVHPAGSTGEHLVRIALVPDVPDQLVARRVEAAVQRDGQFDNSQAGADVAAGDGARFNEECPDIVREHAQLVVRERADVGGGFYAVKNRHGSSKTRTFAAGTSVTMAMLPDDTCQPKRPA